ncbi:MAG: hypothetical protein Q9225_006864 [Loekoesia sp. 1 TL-2023]
MRTFASFFPPFILSFLHTLPTSAIPSVPGHISQISDGQVAVPTTPSPPTATIRNRPQVHVLGDPNYLLADPCGPPNAKSADVRGSKSTCNASVSADLAPDSPFKLDCKRDDTGYTMNWNTCRAAVNAACALLVSATNPLKDQWIWAPAPRTNQGTALNCTLGFWYPSNGALLPDFNRCRDDIWGRMIDGCATKALNNVAAVNLERLPRRTQTERDTGKAVDPGYPSKCFTLF